MGINFLFYFGIFILNTDGFK